MVLERQAAPPSGDKRDWLRDHLAGLLASVLGLMAIAVAALVYMGNGGEVTRMPNPWITTPFLVMTLAAAIASLVRREGAYVLAGAGVGLAAAAMVIGWAIVVGAVALATVVIILILHQVM